MHPVRIGQVTVTRVVEIEGANSPRFTQALFPELDQERLAAHREWLAPYFLEPDTGKLVMSVHAFVVRTRYHTLLVDTCVGNSKNRQMKIWHQRQGPFLEDLARAGVRPEQVDCVLCTHLHADHVGWNTRLVSGSWVPTFPNATYLLARKEWDYWKDKDGDEYGAVIADSVRPVVEAGLVRWFAGEHPIDDEALIVPTPGHTPGHVSLRLASQGEEAVITGDMIHHPFQCAEPDIVSGFCVQPDQARATRRAFLERYADRSTLILGTHFAAPTAGRIVHRGGVFRLALAE
jgi:glyoxylase-like metal-dependent hydrolase (beta-lactamase superfamily II)